MKNASCAVLLTAVLAAAQQRAFDSASLKPAAPTGNYNPPFRRQTPVRMEYRNYPFRRLMAEAYGLADYQFQVPAWIERERYDLTAIRPRNTSAADTRRMMQSLLAERFHLSSHRAMKEMPVYELVPEKPALLRPEHDEAEAPGCESFGTLADFANLTARILNTPVIDKTGIPGNFYFILTWRPNGALAPLAPGAAPPPPMPAAPPPCPGWSAATMPPPANDIFEAARKQMGLKLERRGRASVEITVVGHADRVPAAN